MSHWFSPRVTCLCAQFEAVLQHGLKRSRGLALTAAAIKQAAGFASKTETVGGKVIVWDLVVSKRYGVVWHLNLNEVIFCAEFSEPHGTVSSGFRNLQHTGLFHQCDVPYPVLDVASRALSPTDFACLCSTSYAVLYTRADRQWQWIPYPLRSVCIFTVSGKQGVVIYLQLKMRETDFLDPQRGFLKTGSLGRMSAKDAEKMLNSTEVKKVVDNWQKETGLREEVRSQRAGR
ncbi:hypothetical protein P7K49_023014 [Saguinus oedipus]|uniref:Uncharacterized protein n=1 Tax=Saguinus oedipus TaxID=9490 RepID=A0ABQ9UKG4_SAGOE|nr:hypothetical protein P7K49_023014 [Saguinus oedipus]